MGWFVIHPLAGFWRRRGPAATYVVVVSFAVSVATLLFQFRKPLLRVEFGFNWILTAVGLVCLACAIVLEHYYRRQLTVGTLLGLPEVSTKHESRLLTDGIYAKIRHPRYVGVSLELLAFSLFVNYLATYVVALALLPMLYLIVVLEERELLNRFGAEYERYTRRVPRFIPKLRSPKA